MLLRGNDVLVGPIRERELRDVIERPAQRAGLQLEQGLVEQILADAQGSSGVLPLLQTALLTTWDRRTGNVLTLGAYQESGGVQGAVARLAETTFAGLTPGQQDAARRILLRLAEASDDGTLDLRRRVRVDDIASRDDADARVAYEEMVRHRLLISTRGHRRGEPRSAPARVAAPSRVAPGRRRRPPPAPAARRLRPRVGGR